MKVILCDLCKKELTPETTNRIEVLDSENNLFWEYQEICNQCRTDLIKYMREVLSAVKGLSK